MKASSIVCCLWCLVWLGVWGCGDDSATDAGAGSGGSGGTSVDGGGGGSGGSGGTGGTSGTGGNSAKAECLARPSKLIPPACLDCACTTNASVTAQCNDNCWRLLICVGLSCAGKVDDLNCIGAKCSEHLAGTAQAMAMVASPVILACADECIAGWTANDGGVEEDGGP